MRRTLTFVALWVVAGAVAAGLAIAGVAVVDDQLTGHRPAPLTAAEVRREAAASSGTSTTLDDRGSTTTTTSASTTSTTAGPGPDGSSTPVVPTTTAPAPPPVTRTYDLVGGTATLRFSAAGISVVAATPAPGFTVDIEDAHDGGKRVEFESEDHESRLDAWWAGGPQAEVREDAD